MPTEPNRQRSSSLSIVGKSALLSGLAAAGWIVFSRFRVDHRLPLPPAMHAERERVESSRFLSVYVDRSAAGRPLVLLHSINAAASAYEMRPIFEHYRKSRPVYALDLPGFGFSDRADRVYSPDVYREAILDLLRQKVNEPADVVALSLSGEFAALAALDEPERFHSLTLISPSGFTRREEQGASPQANEWRASAALYRFLAFPLWSQALYDLLTTRRSLRWFLEKSFAGRVDESLAEYSYATTHRPGAQLAPLAVVGGKLFTPDIRERAYER